MDWLTRNFLSDVDSADQVSGDFKQVLGKDFAPQPYTQLVADLKRPFDWVFGYGHLPGRAGLVASGIILFAILFYDVILTPIDWRLIAAVGAATLTGLVRRK